MAKSKSQPDDSGPLFDWRCWETKLPPLKEHSQAKLNVLQQYIEDYITILCTGNPGQDRFRMTLVDGFAGGGIYEGGSIGSPFVLLRAFKAAEARVNMGRTKPIKFDCHFYFVEENAAAMQCLQHQLKDQGYAREFDESIFLIQNTFQESVARIVSDTQRRYPRGGSRVIFFLDQCGYSDVPPTMLRDISGKLHQKAEFIINIGIDWLTNYMANKEVFKKTYPNLGLDSVLPVEKILVQRESMGRF